MIVPIKDNGRNSGSQSAANGHGEHRRGKVQTGHHLLHIDRTSKDLDEKEGR